ncbi:asparaginase [Curtobacterium sp. MCBD17_034]|uniref:asparaginase n=1 Tax=unclassified Curtobacterium TaxID=257496 RepID=UPI000DA757E3|nr:MULTISPECIES: asparaginase [unclassified Curtobacterium]PZF59116.1 asparaginase [Curtobacterium sp. MCBD17_034]PZM34341.1 asparaginase [Curtobacterium sp. MCBD17_031]
MPGTADVRSDRHPLTADGSVELAVVARSGFDESRHVGAGVVVDADGRMVDVVGDAAASVWTRSTLKPFQAIAVRRTGARFERAQLVLSTASHAGTPAHQEVAAAMLAAWGHDEDTLGCPPDFPFDGATARRMTAPRRLAMNCSGKHAAMLASCALHGWDRSTYLAVDHPLQRVVVDTVEDLTRESVDVVGVDGCGAPVVPLTLHGLARGIATVVGPTDADGRALTTAVLAEPWAIDGPGRANTLTIERLGVLAKLGAEGVMVMGVPGSGAVAVKVLDGSQRAGTLAALTLLARSGMVDPDDARAVIAASVPSVLGGGQRVGGVRPGRGLVA